MPDQELLAQMRQECPIVDLQAEHRRFVDFWIAKPGREGTKLDWPATWRNWVRRASERTPTRAPAKSARGEINWEAAAKRAQERDQAR
jgi:hypothetical protein